MKQTTSNILMVRPASFGFNEETAGNNVFQGKVALSSSEVIQKAKDEFDAFVGTLKAKGIDVLVIEDTLSPVKPDAIFPNNWFSTMPNGYVYLFPMFATVRRIERRVDITETLEKTFIVNKVEDWSSYEDKGEILEGTGSIIFDHLNKLAYACLSPRTDATLMEKYCQSIGYFPIMFTSSDENDVPIYHTNVMLHIGTNYAIVCLESIKNEQERSLVAEKLSMGGRVVIPITLEQVRNYCGNMLQVSSDSDQLYTVMSRSAYASLTMHQKAMIELSSQLLPVDIPVIETVGGGSARCMMAEIFLTKK